MPWVKKRVWIVTALLKDEDEEGNSLNWSSYIEEYTCETYDKALELKEKLLAGEDEYYGDLIESVEISDEPEEREFWQKEEEKATDERGEIFEKTQALGKAGSDLVSWFGDYAVYEKKFGVSDEQILEAYAELERSEISENEREWRDNMADLKDDLIYGIEDKFTSQDMRDNGDISTIKISEITPFQRYPYLVRDDENMMKLVESIKTNGVMVPAIAFINEDKKIELVSGHRRMRACQLAGIDTMPVIVRDITRDQAAKIMVKSNMPVMNKERDELER